MQRLKLKCDKRYVIDANKPWHVAWWAAELGVSEDSLLEAVDVVGNQARAVEFHLRLGRARERRRARRSADAAWTIEIVTAANFREEASRNPRSNGVLHINDA
jgi:hypothetical protein